MRSRGLILSVVLVALFGASCSSDALDDPAANRAVGDEGPDWDTEQAILRTEVLEANMDNGFRRDQAVCMVDTATADGTYALSDLEGIDLTASNGSSLRDAELREVLAQALVECGPSLRARLKVDIPGALSAPATHATAGECTVNSYVDAWRNAYDDAFASAPVAEDAIEELSVNDKVAGIVDGCEAGGAIILGASGDGHAEVAALSTLEWICLDDELDPEDFLPAFPFPEEPGDALDRMGPSVTRTAEFCRDWVAAGSDAERAEVEAAYR